MHFGSISANLIEQCFRLNYTIVFKGYFFNGRIRKKRIKMKIDIAIQDLQALRDIMQEIIWQKENCLNPKAWGDSPKVARKFNRKINKALKKIYGHDCGGNNYYT